MNKIFRFLFASVMIMSLIIAGNQLAVAADGQIFFKGSSTLAPVVSQVAQQFMVHGIKLRHLFPTPKSKFLSPGAVLEKG